MRRPLRDPFWTKAKFNGKDVNGNPVKKGDPIFYYPSTRTVLTGDAAEKASAEFQASAQDEAAYSGGTY